MGSLAIYRESVLAQWVPLHTMTIRVAQNGPASHCMTAAHLVRADPQRDSVFLRFSPFFSSPTGLVSERDRVY